ncbi:glycosyltransferase family 39 protein [Oryzobacter telluris]|uniref:glycosyltransferase family 39 protein n=1 Tax=Oryzobacter telluris TaxID=3149179 RepID=UPI00370D4F5D
MFPTALLLVLVLAGTRRFAGLGRLGLTGDEAVYLTQGLGPGDPGWAGVRAHPPLWGMLLALVPDAVSRESVLRGVAVVVGLVSVVVAGLLAREVAGRWGGVAAAVALASMPYHADVTRLVLVDVPMATGVAVALLLLVRGTGDVPRPRLVEAAGAGLGVATLFKETAVLTVVAIVLAWAVGALAVDRRTGARALAWFVAIVALYPAWLVAVGGLDAAAGYVRWQLVRGPSGGVGYVDTVLPRIGWGVLGAAVVGGVVLVAAGRRHGALLALAVLVPATFYAAWPVSGYPYLLATTVPLSALAGVGASTVATGLRARVTHNHLPLTAAFAVAALATGPAATSAEPPPVPGSSGVPAVREAATWLVREHLPVVTAATWVADVVRLYARGSPVSTLTTARTVAADVNPAHPRHRTAALPAGPVAVVWDAWSASTDPTTTSALLDEVRAAGGRVAHVESAPGTVGARPLVVVFVVGAPAARSSPCCAPSPPDLGRPR